jgi:hypothetical protein
VAPPRLAVAALALLSLGVGCATFAEYPEAPFTPAPTVRSLDVKVVVASYLVANDSEFETARTGGFAAQVVRALEESGRFAPLTEGGAAGELEAMVAVKAYQSEMHGGLLGLLTCFLIPTAIDYRVELDLALRERQTGRTALIDKRFGYRAWHQLFLLPLYFSHSPAAFEREVTAAMTREAVAEALVAVSDPPGP